MRIRLTLFIVLVCLFTFPWVALADDNVVQLRESNGVSLNDAYYIDDCRVDSVNLYLANGKSLNVGPEREFTTFGQIAVTRINICTGIDELYLFANVEDLEFSPHEFFVNPSLNQAWLHATIPVYDRVSDRMVDVTFNLDWTASASPTRLNQHHVYQASGFTVRVNGQAVGADASVNGMISANGITFDTADAPFYSASLYFTHGVEIYHYE